MHSAAIVLARFLLSLSILGLGVRNLHAQSGTLQAPAQRPIETTPKPPAAAPRQSVKQVEGKSTPVVQPRGPTHAHKPARKTKSSTPKAQPAPPPAEPAPSGAAEPNPPTKPVEAAKPPGTKGVVPRFAALRFDEVNMRRGPGPRFPIDWVYKRRDLPVEIEREFDIYRLIRDPDGTRGWVSEVSLTGRRSFIVTAAEATLRREPSEEAAPAAILKAGVIGRIRRCEAAAEWCNVQTGEYRGYLKRSQFWGTRPGEAIPP